jgi:hypothetical protein
LTAGEEATGPVLQALRIGGQPVPLEAFYRIPRAPSEADGVPLCWVNLPQDDVGEPTVDGGSLHVLWPNRGGEARRALVPAVPSPDADQAAWTKLFSRH